MKNDCLLYHPNHVEDFMRKSITQYTFVSNEKSNVHFLHKDIQGIASGVVGNAVASQEGGPGFDSSSWSEVGTRRARQSVVLQCPAGHMGDCILGKKAGRWN
ncbi:hypothetical protein SRHO_G00203890 [Serrasalmus rhombeus]